MEVTIIYLHCPDNIMSKLGHSTGRVTKDGKSSVAIRLEKRRANEMNLKPGDLVEVDVYKYEKVKE